MRVLNLSVAVGPPEITRPWHDEVFEAVHRVSCATATFIVVLVSVDQLNAYRTIVVLLGIS